MVVIGYELKDGKSFTLTSLSEATYGENPVRETFATSQRVTITGPAAVEFTATLDRIVARLNLLSTNARPVDANNIRMTFSRGAKAFRPTTGLAVSDDGFSNTVTLTSAVGNTTGCFSYLFLSTDEQTMDVTIDILDASGCILSHHMVENVPFKRNRKTCLSGNLYSSSPSASFLLDTDWLEETEVSLAFSHRLIIPLPRYVDVRRTDDPPVLEVQFFEPVRTPADNPGHRKNGRVQLLRDADHLIDKPGIEVQIRADRPAARVHLADAFQPAGFDPLEELELLFVALFLGHFAGHTLQRDGAGVAHGIHRVAQAVDQTGPVVSLLPEHPHQVFVYLLVVLPVLDLVAEMLEHVGHHHVGAAVEATLQGADARGDGRVDVCLRGTRHANGEGRVVTTAMLGLDDHQQVQHPRLHGRIIAAKHPQEVLGQ